MFITSQCYVIEDDIEFDLIWYYDIDWEGKLRCNECECIIPGTVKEIQNDND